MKFCLLLVHFHVITLTIPILGLRIISESCQSPHIIRIYIIGMRITSITLTKSHTKDKDNDKDKRLKRPTMCYAFKKQGIQGCQWEVPFMIHQKHQFWAVCSLGHPNDIVKYDIYNDHQNHQVHQGSYYTRFTRITTLVIFTRFQLKKGSSVLPIYSELFKFKSKLMLSLLSKLLKLSHVCIYTLCILYV